MVAPHTKPRLRAPGSIGVIADLNEPPGSLDEPLVPYLGPRTSDLGPGRVVRHILPMRCLARQFGGT